MGCAQSMDPQSGPYGGTYPTQQTAGYAQTNVAGNPHMGVGAPGMNTPTMMTGSASPRMMNHNTIQALKLQPPYHRFNFSKKNMKEEK